MAVNNSLAESRKKTPLTAYLTNTAVKNQIQSIVGKSDGRFISGIVSAVSVNPTLQECTNQSILSGALLGESLKLSPSPQLGQYYLVPFNNRKAGVKIAQFQLGYKGYIQLAIRSGQYRKINVVAIKEGELEYFDPLQEEIKVNIHVENRDKREQAKTIGYYAMFELVNGFRKAIYWSMEQMTNHADKFSSAFDKESYVKLQNGQIPEKDLWKYSSFWYKNFDEMAYKTMLRQLISKWGVMSIDMQKAYEFDMSEVKADGTKVYVENDDFVVDMEETPQPQETQETVQDDSTDQNVAGVLFNE